MKPADEALTFGAQARGADKPRCRGCRAVLNSGMEGLSTAQDLSLGCPNCGRANTFNAIDGRWFHMPTRPRSRGHQRRRSAPRPTMNATERHHRLVEVHDIMGWERGDRVCGPLDCPICDA